jgi:isopropylmalate/homocitrate/citramalate synthase
MPLGLDENVFTTFPASTDIVCDLADIVAIQAETIKQVKKCFMSCVLISWENIIGRTIFCIFSEIHVRLIAHRKFKYSPFQNIVVGNVHFRVRFAV